MARLPLAVYLPTRLPGHEDGAWLKSRSDQWHCLKDEYRSARGYTVPDWMFDEEHRVRDEAAYVISADGGLRRTRGDRIRRGCVALVVEAPHREEFAGPGGRALAPLQNRRIREDLEARLPGLLRTIPDRGGRGLAGRQVALVNAVQYQASLHSLARHWQSQMQEAVRNAVWKAIFQAGGGADLVARLNGYAPHLVLLASATPMRKPLLARVRDAGPRWPSYRLGSHPSGWWRAPPAILEQVAGPTRPEPFGY